MNLLNGTALVLGQYFQMLEKSRRVDHCFPIDLIREEATISFYPTRRHNQLVFHLSQ